MSNKNKNINVAVIDVGTLKSKFEIREFDENLKSKLLYKDKQLTVLGRDLDKNDNLIIEKSIVKTIDALKDFREKLAQYGVTKYIAVTTEAIRKAKNAQEVLARIRRETDIDLKTLSHEEEARLYFSSVSHDFKDQTIAVSDIGGGSVQVVIGKNEEVYETHLFKTGTYYLQEGFSQSHLPTVEEVENAYKYVRSELEILKKAIHKPSLLVYGSTNIIDFLRAMNISLKEDMSQGSHSAHCGIEQIMPVYEKIIKLSYEDRMLLYPDEPYYMWAADKAIMNVETIARYLGIRKIVPSNNNISTGLLFNLASSALAK